MIIFKNSIIKRILKSTLENFSDFFMALRDIINNNGLIFFKELRFPISLLEIEYEDFWREFPRIIAAPPYQQYELSDILFDTGNIANYCEISGIFYGKFRHEFPSIKFFEHLEKSNISIDELNFRFNDCVEFKSYLGFTKQTSLHATWLDRINVNISSITQFITIICPFNPINNENKFICAQSLGDFEV